MAQKFLTSLDLQNNEVLNLVFEQLSSAPITPAQGRVYTNTTDNQTYVYTNSEWVKLTSQKLGKYTSLLGDDAAQTFVVNHSLETSDVTVSIREVSGTKEIVFADIEITDDDNITIDFDNVPTTGQYKVTIIG